ncbi:SNF2-related protein [Desulfofarcimen acetoxidans DSM 771]|uniref:SNF2-related protein n=1 Tax=Desulfofarcimen acetoxidans (strain ATCC 49208 / DSM 771 / KCTC 5769 / VKM B-1644 / 5575) TaxID=485916 RepID=C8W012_DESAS|nr:DEAD/DEAH box helicase [Desulfofarcimen acetoxidans]ACV64980.1 SNF2-related protein [Desulfofarcimen acetoxidans DSM 771]
MTPRNIIRVSSQWLGEGVFFIRAEQQDLINHYMSNVTELKFRLFTRHRPTFYGTFVETMEHNRQVGLKLSPRLALDFFAESTYSKFLDWQWSEEILKLRQIAPRIKEALSQGHWRPDFQRWPAGKPAWKLDWPADQDLSALPHYTAEWIDGIINDLIAQNQEISLAWVNLRQIYPLLGNHSGVNISNEESWLEAIGWKQDDTPFKTCLQLIEPGEDYSEWNLKVLLQDKVDAAKLVEWHPDLFSVDEAFLRANSAPESSQSEDNILVAEAEVPAQWEDHRRKIVRDINRWLELVPWLADRQNSCQTGEEPSLLRRELGETEAWQFLASDSLQLADAGYTVFLPKWWEEVQHLKPLLKVKTRSSVGNWGEGWLGADRLVQFDWRLSVGDVELSEEEFRQLADKKRRLMQIRGKWVQLDPAFLQKVQKIIKQKKNMSLPELLQMHFLSPDREEKITDEDGGVEEDLQVEVELNQQLSSMVEQLKQQIDVCLEEPSSAFRGKLRQYQVRGSSWLLFLRRFGLGGCLADDMGLGKTIQWISYLLKVKEKENPSTPSLLICPTSVIGNWQKELARFAPDIRVHLHYGSQREKGEAFPRSLAEKDLVLTSYNLAHLDETELGSVEWDCICLDEAQHIKNAYTKQASAIRRFAGRHRVALTGTPMENRLTELWSIMDFLNPRYLGSINEFNKRFVSVIERKREEKHIKQVQRLIRPFLLRRVKTDPAIELDLPEKQELKEYIPLTVEQASLYENTLQNMFERLEEAAGMARRGVILSTLMKLKQLCDHPALFLKEEVPSNIRERSLKLERLLEMVEKLRQEGDSCLIFTQFVGMGQMIQRLLQKELKEEVYFLYGGTPRARREEMITGFQNFDTTKNPSNIFVLSLKAGGLGLNLTAASHVFHFDRWWNPAVENQATDRSHRIGQQRHVQVHKFICLGTLEERIDEMLERKQGLNEQIVGGSEAWITELSTGELREVFALRREWVAN